MTNQSCKEAVQRKTTLQLFFLLTMCFTLCGAAACLGVGEAPKKWTDMLSSGNEALKTGDAATAEKMFESAAQECEKKYGKFSGQRATCLEDLALLYKNETEYRKADLAYKELIAVEEKVDPNGSNLPLHREQYNEVLAKEKEYNLNADPNAPATPAVKPAKDAEKKDKESKPVSKKKKAS
jgi:hypothetical protein